jgi:threonine/homoserine/homoserine lactone efflux protein
MIEASWFLFTLASLALIALPGQDMILVMSRSIAQGAPFLPQFVQPSARHPTLTVLVLGLAFAALTFVVKAPVALCSGALSARLRAHPGVLALIYRSTGAILVCLGVRLALERR